MPRPSPRPLPRGCPSASPSRRNVAVVSHTQYVLTVTAAPASRVKAALSKAACDFTFDLLTLKVVSESHDYICANNYFGFPRPLCSQVRPDVRVRQTSDRRQTKASLNAPAY